MELADVAQLVVRRTCNAKAAGSSPVIGSYVLADLDDSSSWKNPSVIESAYADGSR